jgi:protein-S-isoprenylcysteine O-methyltransferase Ste14
MHFLLVILASSGSTWQLPIHKMFSLSGGSILFALGFIIMLAGMMQFRSWRKISGLDTSKMITTGIYKRSRNPQYTGWFMWLLGISLVGRSGFAFLLTIIFIIGIHLYNVWLEEPYLERIFGEEYSVYRLKTSRYIGIPKI